MPESHVLGGKSDPVASGEQLSWPAPPRPGSCSGGGASRALSAHGPPPTSRCHWGPVHEACTPTNTDLGGRVIHSEIRLPPQLMTTVHHRCESPPGEGHHSGPGNTHLGRHLASRAAAKASLSTAGLSGTVLLPPPHKEVAGNSCSPGALGPLYNHIQHLQNSVRKQNLKLK